MALMRIDHVPETVKVNSPLYVILPEPGKVGGRPIASSKVLYLLHGHSDDGSAWQRYTAIESIAALYNLVVVMPSAGLSFYTDQPNGQSYFTYITEELPHYLQYLFGLSHRREDTLIAGNSMSGYGAFKAAFLHPELYTAAASFSGLLSLAFLKISMDDPRLIELKALFGDLSQLPGSLHDPDTWIKNVAANPSVLPRLYAACGRQDDLYPLNTIFRATCEAASIPLDYHEEDGFHDWFFWNTHIQHFLAANLSPL
ncbi:MAG: esterase family protein [Anaerolineae bacterium]|nr:esterase family protein [Anaerolineae bacterium]